MKITFGTLKKKNHKGLKAFIRNLLRKTDWIVDDHLGKELPLIWDTRKKIDDSFDGKEVGFEFVEIKGKFKANIVTFNPEAYKKMYLSGQ